MAVHLDPDRLKKFVVRKGGGAEKELLRRGDRIVAKAQSLCSNRMVNVQTGRLRASIRSEIRNHGNGLTLSVGSDVEYAKIVHEGRGPVFARPGRVLGPMTLGGKPNQFRKFVGPAKARPFLTEAMRTTR